MSRRSTRSPAKAPLHHASRASPKSAYAPGIVVAMELVDTSGNGTSWNPRPNEPQAASSRAAAHRCAVTSTRPGSDMKLSPQDLESITGLTLDHYNRRAEAFWQGTRDHDVKQNIAALLQRIEGAPPFTILDFGCGPGRDLKVFAERGTSRSVWKAPRISPRWRAPIAAAKYGSRISSSSICRTAISMACSPTPRCFMSPARNCRACCWSCAQSQTGWRAVQLESARQ